MKCKVCSDCGKEKPIQDFRWKEGRPGRRCEVCAKIAARIYYLKNKDRIKAVNKRWQEANKESLTAYRKRYWEHNREWLLEVNKKWRKANKDRINASYRARYVPHGKPQPSYEERMAHKAAVRKAWMANNRDKVAEYKSRYYQKNKERINRARCEQRRAQRAREREDVLLDLWDDRIRETPAMACSVEARNSTHSQRTRARTPCRRQASRNAPVSAGT